MTSNDSGPRQEGRSPDGPSLEFGALHATLWISVALFVMLALVMLVVALRPDAQHDLVTLGGASAVAFLLTSVFLLGKHPAGPRLGDAIGLRGSLPVLAPLGLLLGAALQVPAEALERVSQHFVPMTEAEALARLELLRPHSPAHGVLLVIVAALVVPLAEEVFFRGALYGALRRSGRSGPFALFVTSVGFTLCHLDPAILLPILFVALVFGFLRVVSGSLVPSLAAHVGFNGLTMIGAVTGARSGEAAFPPAVEVGGYVSSAVLLLVIAAIAGRSESARSSRLADRARVRLGQQPD